MNIVMDLSGIWQFRLDSKKQGLHAHYELLDFDDTITLPTTVSEALKGTPHHRTDTGHLTDPYEMEGYSWYRKVVELPLRDLSGLSGRHFELTLERTRISYVWVDGRFAGSFDSLVARHCYDLTGLVRTLHPVITVMVSNTDYKVPGGHLTSPDTQTNWNGILGEISLTVRERIRLCRAEARCDYDKKGFSLAIPVQYDGERPCPGRLQVLPVLCRLKDIYAGENKNIPDTGNYEDLVDHTPLPAQGKLLDVILQPGENHYELFLDLSEAPELWDEENPSVYRLQLSCRETGNGSEASDASEASSTSEYACDTASLWCGLRSFTAGRTHFYINGRKTFLRGRQDGMIFPLTGYAPTDVTSWLRVMKTARNYGINHYRFHTCCPPEAAFIAADLLGIYMQPEIPFWGTFCGPEDDGYNEEAQSFLEQEGFQMLETFGAHPSYCMMTMGNELWGNASAINDLLAKYKAFRPDILYAQGSNNFFWTPNIQPCDDFFSGVRFTIDRQIRGSYAMCDAPLGHVQTAVPGTRFCYDEAIRPSCLTASPDPAVCRDGDFCTSCPVASPDSANAELLAGDKKETDEDDTVEIQYGTGVKRVRLSEVRSQLIPEVPVISHEIGQYVFYPDFREISKYTGVLKARNLEEFKRRLEAAGMSGFAEDFFRSAGALAAACYKDELETALRSSRLAGFQLLDLQDFTGQGTALVGILNPFMENKGLISAADWRKFCSDTVLQAEFDSYVVIYGNPFEFTVSLSYYRKAPLPADELVCSLTDSDGNVIWRDIKSVTKLTERNRDSAAYQSESDLSGQAVKDCCPEKEYSEKKCSKKECSEEVCSGKEYYEKECGGKPLTRDKGVFLLGTFTLQDTSLAGNSLKLPYADRPSALTLTVELTGLNISNSYQLWFYPAVERTAETDLPALPLLTGTASKAADAVACSLEQLPELARNHRAGLLFLPAGENRASVQGTYCTDFWCYAMFRSISLNIGKEPPVGTMGLLIRREHEALSGFPCETYTTPQWHSIVNASRSTILDGTNIVPIVQTIDNFFRNHRLGLLYEIYLQDLDLHLLVCTSDLPGLIKEGHPEALALYRSLLSCLPTLGKLRRNADSRDTAGTDSGDMNAGGTMTLAAFRNLVSREITENPTD